MIKTIIIDDEPNIREGLKLIIDWNQLGYNIVGEASNGIDGLDIINKLQPELVITDIKMPHKSGLDIIEDCKTKGLNIHFIIISGHSEFHMAQKAIRLGATNYILKPLDENELQETLINLKTKIDKETTYKLTTKQILETNFKQLLTSTKVYNFNEIKESLNITNQRSFYYIILDTYRELSEELLHNILCNLIPKEFPFCFNNHDEGCYGLLIHSGMLKLFNNNINMFIMDLISTIYRDHQKNISVYIGLRITNLEEIKTSMDTAIITLKHRYYRDKGVIIDYQNVQFITFNEKYEECDIIPEIINVLFSNNQDDLEQLIHKLINYFREEYYSAQIIYLHLNRLFNLILNNIKKLNGCSDTVFEAANFIINREENFFLFTLSTNLLHLSNITKKLINNITNKKSLGLELRDYINSHYQENISLKWVSEIFNVNSAYLGQVFKKEIGKPYNNYINEIRLERAKELLITSNLKIYEVATNSGFQDVNYFMKKFESHFNTTPKQYRKTYNKSINL